MTSRPPLPPEAPRERQPVPRQRVVKIMAPGEHWSAWPDAEHPLYVKVGTGIGCGIVAGGEIHRGAEGTAGDIGHIRLTADDAVVCRCGNVGCLAVDRALAAALEG